MSTNRRDIFYLKMASLYDANSDKAHLRGDKPSEKFWSGLAQWALDQIEGEEDALGK